MLLIIVLMGEMTIVSVYNDPNSYQAAFGRLNSAFLTHSLDSRHKVIVGGDFNGRTRNLCYLPHDVPLPNDLPTQPESVDPTVNNAGRTL